MKCLVTGGAGFIGSYLCDRLIAEGNEVWCLDNLITGNKKNIEHLVNNPRFNFIRHDCVIPITKDLNPDIIFHFASPASPPKYQKFPVETLLTNSYGTYLLLKLAKKKRAKFVYASTSEIYGDPREHPQKETYFGNVNPTGERACYNESKRAGETFVSTFSRKYGIDSRIIRIFNTYGPRMDINDGRVVTNFIKQILNKSPLVIQGDGSQTRSFCYISDLINGIMLVTLNSGARNEVFNLGNTEEITILELAALVKKITNCRNNIIFKDLPSDDPVRRKPDISKIQNLTGWKPEISLKEGLEKTYSFFNKNK